MSEHEAYERIVASLHEVALDHTRWSGATALIDEALRVHGSAMVFGDGDSAEDVRIHFAWIFFRGQRQRETEREYYENYYPVDERVPRLRHAPDGRLLHVSDLLTEEELKTSATYNEMMVRGRCRDSVHVRLDGPAGSRIVWIVQDPVDGGGWSPGRLDAVRRLLPHIRHTVGVQQALAGANALGATLAELLDNTGVGIIQLDARGRIVAVNDRARDVLRSGAGVFDAGGFLFARSPRDDARPPGASVPRPAAVRDAGGGRLDDRETHGGRAAARAACEPGGPAGDGHRGVAGRGARAGRRTGKRSRHRRGRGRGGARPHGDGEPGGGAADARA